MSKGRTEPNQKSLVFDEAVENFEWGDKNDTRQTFGWSFLWICSLASFVSASVVKRFFAGIAVATLLLTTSYGAESQKQTKRSSGNADRAGRQPVHLVVKSRAEIKQIFTYFSIPPCPPSSRAMLALR